MIEYGIAKGIAQKVVAKRAGLVHGLLCTHFEKYLDTKGKSLEVKKLRVQKDPKKALSLSPVLGLSSRRSPGVNITFSSSSKLPGNALFKRSHTRRPRKRGLIASQSQAVQSYRTQEEDLFDPMARPVKEYTFENEMKSAKERWMRSAKGS
mmetsp:Transcript_7608/g.11761  ORF Transcript_7608/g.11761 Transcript_7608/m.11761 type:complete len:151 (-) Transcript_7608:44-496(-)